MSIFTMKRVWLSLSLPFLVYFLTDRSIVIITSIVWFPVSLMLLAWAFFSFLHVNKEPDKKDTSVLSDGLAEPGMTADKTAPAAQFYLFDKTFTFVESLSATVLNKSMSNDHVWVKTDSGQEREISDYSVAFRKSHHINCYNLEQRKNGELYYSLVNALVINTTTGEYKLNIPAKTIFIPAFFTVLSPGISCATFNSAMPVPKSFFYLFSSVCAVAFISFIILPWGFKDGYIWSEHAITWIIYIFSRTITFFCIKWIKSRNEKFEAKISDIITTIKSF